MPITVDGVIKIFYLGPAKSGEVNKLKISSLSRISHHHGKLLNKMQSEVSHHFKISFGGVMFFFFFLQNVNATDTAKF